MSSKYTRNRILNTLKTLTEIEKNAYDVYEEILRELKDEELRDTISYIIKSEEKHQKMIEDAIRLIEKRGG